MNEKNVQIWFEISVKDDDYSWDAIGKSKVEISIPLEFTNLIDPGNIFTGSLAAAIADYQEKKVKVDSEKEDDAE